MQKIGKISSAFPILSLVLFAQVSISRSALIPSSSGDLSSHNTTEADGSVQLSNDHITTLKPELVYNRTEKEESTWTVRSTTVSDVDSQLRPTTYTPVQVPSVASADKPTEATTPIKNGDVAVEEVTTESMDGSGSNKNYTVTNSANDQIPNNKVVVNSKENNSSLEIGNVFETSTRKSSQEEVQDNHKYTSNQTADNNATVATVNEIQPFTSQNRNRTENISNSENITSNVNVFIVNQQQDLASENVSTERLPDQQTKDLSQNGTNGSTNTKLETTTLQVYSTNNTLLEKEASGTANQTGYQLPDQLPPPDENTDNTENGKHRQRNMDNPPLDAQTEISTPAQNATNAVEPETTATTTNPTTAINNRTQEDLNKSTQPPVVDSTVIYNNDSSPESALRPPTTNTNPTTSTTTTTRPTQNTTLVPPTENNDNAHSVHQFFLDLRTHTVLCLVSILLLLLVATIIFSFILASMLIIKYSAIGLVKLCKAMTKCCTHRKCCSSGGGSSSGFHDSGSLFPRCDINIRPYDERVLSERDRDMMY